VNETTRREMLMTQLVPDTRRGGGANPTYWLRIHLRGLGWAAYVVKAYGTALAWENMHPDLRHVTLRDNTPVAAIIGTTIYGIIPTS